jgi:hypothetical protein
MNDTTNNSLLAAHEAFERLRQKKSDPGDSPCKGFSKRLNQLIDKSTLGAPPLSKGRAAWLAKITGSANPTVAAWLKHDTIPAFELLDLVSRFLLQYQKRIDSTPKLILSWLVFGDKSLDPFGTRRAAPSYVPLAGALISEVIKAEKINPAEFDMGRVLNTTAGMLEHLKIESMSQINGAHRSVVSQCLKEFSL